MDSKEKALVEYALETDLETVGKFWDLLEGVSSNITTLISIMERYGFEDGKFPPADSDEEIYNLYRQKLTRLLAICNDAGGRFASPHRFRELGLLEERCQLYSECCKIKNHATQESLALYGVRLARQELAPMVKGFSELCNLLETNKCFLLTRQYLFSQYEPVDTWIRDVYSVPNSIGELPSATAWRHLRQVLWNICGLLHRRGQRAKYLRTRKQNRRGAPRDTPTGELINWAFAKGITIPELASMLVSADLDPDDDKRPKTIPGRVRRETARLRTFLDNREKSQRAPTPSI